MARIKVDIEVAEGGRGSREGASGVRQDFPGPQGEAQFSLTVNVFSSGAAVHGPRGISPPLIRIMQVPLLGGQARQ